MTLKNGIKDYIFMGVFFGIIYSLITGFSKWLSEGEIELSYILILALSTGTLFASLMALVLSFSGRKFMRLRSVITQGKQIVCDGPCTYFGKGGWLVFTRESLEFYIPAGGNLSSGIFIFASDITALKASMNRLTVCTSKGEKYLFIVNKAKKWKEFIAQHH